MNANVAANVAGSGVVGVPDDDDDRDFESAVELEEVECVSVERRFLNLQELCRIMRRKVPGTVTNAVDLTEGLFNQVSESSVQLANNAATVTLRSIEIEVVLLSANMKKAHKEIVSSKKELYALSVAAESAAKKHIVGLEKARGERQGGVKA